MDTPATRECPDITKPIKGFRKTSVQGQTVWLPRGISFVNGLWRITVYGEQVYKPSFEAAWENLWDRLPTGTRQPADHGPKKTIETGVIGVHIGFHFTKRHTYALIRCAQYLNGRARSIDAASINLEEMSQKWLDEGLCAATGLRWFYLHQRRTQALTRWLTVADVPDEWFPEKPVERVLSTHVFEAGCTRRDAYLAKQLARGSTGK